MDPDDPAKLFVPPSADSPPDDAIAAFVEQGGLPGLAVGVIASGDVNYVKVAGVRRTGDPTPVGESDAFHIGSNTKSMTALLAGMMVDEDKLSWTSTIGDVLGATMRDRSMHHGVTIQRQSSRARLRTTQLRWARREPCMPTCSSTSLQEIETPRISAGFGDYGFGWGILSDSAGNRVLAHDGSNTTFYSSLWVIPERGHAIVVMTNMGSAPAPNRVLQVVRYLMGHFLPEVRIDGVN